MEIKWKNYIQLIEKTANYDTLKNMILNDEIESIDDLKDVIAILDSTHLKGDWEDADL